MEVRTRPPRETDRLNALLSRGQAMPKPVSFPILGIDGSVAKAGYAVAHGCRIAAWKFETSKTGVARLAHHRAEITDLVTGLGIRHAVIEGYSMGSKGNRAYATGEAGGTMRLTLIDLGVAVLEVPPNSLKMFLSGKGNTPKTGMPLALYKQYSVEYAGEDEADACGLAMFGAAYWGAYGGEIHKYQVNALKGAALLSGARK
ncbi:hypothetical protein [Paracoccus sp. MKU1]|uniref:hypothetical protein n=1 Tax=Paracoccus sp. MKU1 TaxID=1745182 RepID=UPI00071936D9|nr:hypothetical protein [Paracoccus sp. MKU1]KRW94276.1 hypothetical protein AQY21_20310 [Paracoccus sp. MKU1]